MASKRSVAFRSCETRMRPNGSHVREVVANCRKVNGAKATRQLPFLGCACASQVRIQCRNAGLPDIRLPSTRKGVGSQIPPANIVWAIGRASIRQNRIGPEFGDGAASHDFSKIFSSVLTRVACAQCFTAVLQRSWNTPIRVAWTKRHDSQIGVFNQQADARRCVSRIAFCQNGQPKKAPKEKMLVNQMPNIHFSSVLWS